MYVLKHATSRGSNIFQLFDTSVRPNHFVASRRRWLENQEETVRGRRMGETSGTDLGIKEPRQKLRRAPTAPYRLSCLSKARRRPEKKKIMRCDGTKGKAKDCLREPGQGHAEIPCNDVKMGHH